MAIRGTSGDDELFGGAGDNTIFGLRGWDRIWGFEGDDLLDGGRGRDVIRGGFGRDAIWGGAGKDLLRGGDGGDDFWFNTRHSFDIIADFRGRDALIIDVEGRAFEGVDEDDVDIEHFARFDRIWVDDDLVAKVFGREVGFDDIFLI